MNSFISNVINEWNNTTFDTYHIPKNIIIRSDNTFKNLPLSFTRPLNFDIFGIQFC